MKRLSLVALAAAGTIALTPAAFAQSRPGGAPAGTIESPGYRVAPGAGALAGAAVGTAAGVGLYNGWYSGSLAASLPSSAAGAAATGFVAGVGTVALVDAATRRCRGFHALFGNFLTSPEGCVEGQYVGYGPRMARGHRGGAYYYR